MDQDPKVITFPSPVPSTRPLETAQPNGVIVQIGQQRIAMNFRCHTTVLPPTAAPVVAPIDRGGRKTRKGPRP